MKEKPTNTTIEIWMAAGTLIAGSLIYILWRPDTLLMFNWFSQAGIDKYVMAFRSQYADLAYLFPTWFLYSLPNGLWMFSYSIILLVVWGGVNKASGFWILALFTASAATEIMQKHALLPGTFDAMDLLCYSAGATTAIIYFYIFKQDMSWIKNTYIQH